MHSTLQRPHLHSRQPQPSTSSSSLSLSSTPSNGGKAAAAAVYRRAEDSDNIDDILGSLWPTGAATLYLHHQPLQGSRPPSAQSQPTSSLLSNGQCTPPEDAACGRVAPTTTQHPLHASEHSEYRLVAPSATAPASAAQRAAGVPASGRSVSASIQIGDPEWRVDSPQSMARPLHHLPKLPSPVSPATPAAYHARPHQGVDACRMRPALPNLGLGVPAHRMQASARSVTMGSACHSPSLPTRVMTPAERVARLHAVSGLAARAVARRCMSAHSSVLPAGLAYAEEAAMTDNYSHLVAAQAANCKPTFADVAKGSQDPSSPTINT